jgi:hypothetical protein
MKLKNVQVEVRMSEGYIPFRTRRRSSSTSTPKSAEPATMGGACSSTSSSKPDTPATPATPATLRRGHDETVVGVAHIPGPEMTARAALRVAREAGLELEAAGADVAIRAPDGICPAVFDAIRPHRAEIAALLTPGPGGMTGEDWIVLFEERAAILEYEGGLPRHEAEARAFEYTLVAWRDRVPTARTMGICAHCGRRGEPGMPLVPYGTHETGTTVLHTSCWPAWNAHRIRRGTAFLNSLGITADLK